MPSTILQGTEFRLLLHPKTAGVFLILDFLRIFTQLEELFMNSINVEVTRYE